MASYIIMPKLGMTMVSGTITKWLKKEGDPVEKGEAVFEMETDKLSNTGEAPIDGVLRRILVPEGKEVPVLENVGIIAEANEDISALTGETGFKAATSEETAVMVASPMQTVSSTGRIKATPRAKAVAKELGIDLALVTPTGAGGRISEDDVRAYKAAKVSAAPAEANVKASPLAEKAAADLGIDLKKIKEEGRVLAADLLAYLKKDGCHTSETDASREELKPMSGMRKAIAQNMQYSHMTSPTVTYNASVDMTEMRAYREQLKAFDLKVSYTDLLVKFVAKALTEFPLLNCSVDGDTIIYKNYVNMGVAVALENGLVVPNIPDADRKGLVQISQELKELAAAARNGTLSMDRMRGGTFTITNLGMYGIESFTPIINQPEVAILGVNAMEERVVVRGGEQCVRPFIRLSLTADHRVVDGSVAAQFLHRVKTLMENPALMMA